MENNEIIQIIIGEYNASLKLIDKIEVSKTNGKFTKIGLKIPKVEDPIYGVGRTIALGERDWLIHSILSDNRIKSVEEPGKLIESAIINNLNFREGVILLPSNLYLEFMQFFYNSLNFDIKGNKFYGYSHIPIPDKISEKIIIIENLGVIWKSVKKDKEFLHVDEKKDSYEIYTLNYLDIDPEMVKVIDLNRNK